MDISKRKSNNSRTFTCRFELHIINDSSYTDYEFGDILTNTTLDNGYDIFEDVVDSIDKILKQLYEECFGQFTYIIEMDLTYISTYDYFNGYDEDLEYDYRIIDRYESSYFNKCEE